MKNIAEYLGVVSKILPGDHIHYEAKKTVSSKIHVACIDAANAKRRRRAEKAKQRLKEQS